MLQRHLYKIVARDLDLNLVAELIYQINQNQPGKFKLSDACTLDDTNLEKLISLENAF